MRRLSRLISKIMLCILVVTQTIGSMGITTVHASTPSKTLESLTVSGGSFNTGIKINQDYSIEMTFSLATMGQYKNLFNSSAYVLRSEASKGLYVRHGWYNSKVYTPAVDEVLTVTQKKNITYVNGTQMLKATYQTITPTLVLTFGDFKGTIKGFRVWNSANTLIADYVPALDANNKACMYDKVKGTYIYYSGTCVAGKVVDNTDASDSTKEEESTGNESVEIEKSETELESSDSNTTGSVEYVDALQLQTGTFNTGLKINQDYSIEITGSLVTLSQYSNLYESSVYRLRNESTKGLYAKHGWYNAKVYQPTIDEEFVLLQKKNITYVNEKQVLKATYQEIQDTAALTFGNYKGTISSFRVWNAAGKLVMECLPALDGNNKACMYDTVNKKYVYYSGTCTAVVEEEDVEEGEDKEAEVEDTIIGDIVIESPTYGSASSPSYSTSGSTGNTTSGAEDSVTSGLSENGKKVYEILAQLMKNYDSTRMDVSAYKVTYNEFYSKIVPLIEEEYYWEYYLCYNIYPIANISGSYITTCWIENIDDNFATRRNNVKNSINEFLAGIDSKMTDLDKVLWAHEYVVNRTKYTQSTFACGSASGVLGDGYAMCTGYAEAMQLLLHYVEIETAQLGSGAMNHTWLAVRLDGSWYHIDPTWDDTKQGANGKYSHRYLIRSDKEFQNNLGHYNWKYIDDEQVCSSDKFTSWFVHDVSGTMYYYNGLWYYINSVDNSIKCADIYGTTVETVVSGGSSTLKLVGITGKQLIYTLNGIQTSLTLQ